MRRLKRGRCGGPRKPAEFLGAVVLRRCAVRSSHIPYSAMRALWERRKRYKETISPSHTAMTGGACKLQSHPSKEFAVTQKFKRETSWPLRERSFLRSRRCATSQATLKNRQNQAMAKGGKRSTSWKRGQSGNPGGRPRKPATVEARQVIHDVKEAARALTAKAIATLENVMEKNPKAPPAARVGAATTVLDRGWGRPTQSIEGNVEPFSLADLVALSMEQRARKAEQAKLIEAQANQAENGE
jgi:hypothetical protein